MSYVEIQRAEGERYALFYRHPFTLPLEVKSALSGFEVESVGCEKTETGLTLRINIRDTLALQHHAALDDSEAVKH